MACAERTEAPPARRVAAVAEAVAEAVALAAAEGAGATGVVSVSASETIGCSDDRSVSSWTVTVEGRAGEEWPKGSAAARWAGAADVTLLRLVRSTRFGLFLRDLDLNETDRTISEWLGESLERERPQSFPDATPHHAAPSLPT